MTGTVTTRIAPSPTGSLHIGTARGALFNYLFAKKQNGTFIIRIEDTDKARSKPEYETEILDSLAWLGIQHDMLYRQSEHAKRHAECIAKLLDEGTAYMSKEAAKEGEGEVELVRFKNPNVNIAFVDIIRGEISMDTTDLGDFVIARSATDPLHHLAVVVDDYDEGVTHAIRGEDLLSNTPRQILIQEALGFPRPQYAHIPLIFGSDRAKLSKRAGTATSIADYRSSGFLPEALVNYLALVGWNPGTDQELFSLEELVDTFDMRQIQKGGAMFSETKLRWFNKHYLQESSLEEQMKSIAPYFPQADELLLRKVTPVIVERIDVATDIARLLAEEEIGYFFSRPSYAPEGLLWRGESDKAKTAIRLAEAAQRLEPLETFEAEEIRHALWPYAELEGKGEVLWPLRYALSGKDKSPDPFTLAEVLGKEETLARIQTALAVLEK